MMSFILSWRRVALAFLLLIVAAGVVAVRSQPDADAQPQPGSATFITNGILVTATNGHATLPTGVDDGVFGLMCTGAAPVGGTARVPGMVITNFGVTETQLRIIQANGGLVNGTVRINCAIEVDLTPQGEAALERLRAAADGG
jgi:hypothetical protein